MINKKKIAKAIKLFLEGIGENPNRKGLLETPARVARMCDEIYAGLDKSIVPTRIIKPLISEEHDEMILLKDIPFYSICEHHLLPFIGKAHVAYIPSAGKIAGIGELARAVEVLAKKPQVQERLTAQLADLLMEKL